MAEKIVQTAGRDVLGEFAPNFAHYNDDILFGENWNDDALDTKTRCMLTVTAIMAQGLVSDALKHHIINAKANGVTKEEMAALIKMQLDSMPSWDIDKQAIEGTNGWGHCYALGFSAATVVQDPVENARAVDHIVSVMTDGMTDGN